MRLAALALIVLVAACSSDPAEGPPADADGFRARVAAALRAEPGRILQIAESRPAEGGGFEVFRETWIDWDTDAVRQEFHGGGGDDAPLTLVVDGEAYHPPSPERQTLEVGLVGHTFEPPEVVVLSIFLLRLTDDSATVSEAEFEGDRVWRLEQDDVSALFDDGETICFNVRIDVDAKTSLPRAAALADCGDPRLGSSPITATWVDRDELPDDFFSPEAATFDLLDPALDSLRSGSPAVYWLGETYGDFRLESVIPWNDGRAGSNASLRYRAADNSGGTIEIFFAPVSATREWMCDFRGSPPAEVVSLSFTNAEACIYNEMLGQLRFTIGDTAVLVDANDVHRDELTNVAEALQPLEDAR